MAARTDPRRLAVLLVLLLVAVVYGVTRLRQGAVGGGSGAAAMPQLGNYSVPGLGWDRSAARVMPTPGGGRNIFSFGPPPTPTPDRRPTPTPPPTQPPRPTVPRPTPTPAPWGTMPPPPPFPLTFVGWLGPERLLVAIFKDGEDVVAAAKGDKVKEKFIIRDITISGVPDPSVTIGFVGYPELVTTKVPLARGM
ncbi:MAG TPA: hypothetical protein PKL08_09325 [Thermoanaerobaculaceae bacterium]|nr:hypothetical protein [Thermoanaerobaculaceae bacterium]